MQTAMYGSMLKCFVKGFVKPPKMSYKQMEIFHQFSNIHPKIFLILLTVVPFYNQNNQYLHFQHFSAKTLNIDCKRKVHLIKSERFEGVDWKHRWKNLHLFIPLNFGFDETLNSHCELTWLKLEDFEFWCKNNHGNRLIFMFPYSILRNVEKRGIVLFDFSNHIKIRLIYTVKKYKKFNIMALSKCYSRHQMKRQRWYNAWIVIIFGICIESLFVNYMLALRAAIEIYLQPNSY